MIKTTAINFKINPDDLDDLIASDAEDPIGDYPLGEIEYKGVMIGIRACVSEDAEPQWAHGKGPEYTQKELEHDADLVVV